MRDALLPPLLAALISPCLAQGTVVAPVARNEAAGVGVADVRGLLTLAQATELALRDRPELAAARSEVEAAEAALSQAGAFPNPVFEAELEDTRRETRTTTYTLSQPIELGGKRSARLDAARYALDAALSQQHSRRQQLRAQASAAFFNALAAQERVRVADAALELAQRGSDAARKRVLAGKASPIDETKAKVAEAAVRVEAVQARGEFRAALLALNVAIGDTAPIERLDGQVSLPAVPSDSDLQVRIASAASVRQAQLEVDRLGALARLERAKRMPDLTVGIGTRRAEESGRSQAMLTLTVPLPIFDTNRSAEVEALKRQDKARHDAGAAVLRLRADVAVAKARLQASVTEARLSEQDILPGALSAHETTTKGFELGKFGFLDVLDSQRTLLQARSQHLKALAEAHLAAAEIERLLSPADAASVTGAPTLAAPLPARAPHAPQPGAGQP